MVANQELIKLERAVARLEQTMSNASRVFERVAQVIGNISGTRDTSISGGGSAKIQAARAAQDGDAEEKKKGPGGRGTWQQFFQTGGGRAAIGAGVGVGGALGAMMQPMQTAQERMMTGLSAGASSLAGSVTAATVETVTKSAAAGQQAGQVASQLASSAMDNMLHRDRAVIADAKSGFADMDELSAMGFEFSDEEYRDRAKANIQQAKRRQKSREKGVEAVGEEYGGLQNVDPAKAAGEAISEVVKMFDVLGKTIKNTVDNIGNLNQQTDNSVRRDR